MINQCSHSSRRLPNTSLSRYLPSAAPKAWQESVLTSNPVAKEGLPETMMAKTGMLSMTGCMLRCCREARENLHERESL